MLEERAREHRKAPTHTENPTTELLEVSYELPLQSLRRRQHVVDHHYPAPCSFLLRLRLTDTTAVDAILHPTAGTTTDVETIPLAADADAMTDWCIDADLIH